MQADIQIDIQTDKQTYRQIKGQTDRQIAIQTDSNIGKQQQAHKYTNSHQHTQTATQKLIDKQVDSHIRKGIHRDSGGYAKQRDVVCLSGCVCLPVFLYVCLCVSNTVCLSVSMRCNTNASFHGNVRSSVHAFSLFSDSKPRPHSVSNLCPSPISAPRQIPVPPPSPITSTDQP